MTEQEPPDPGTDISFIRDEPVADDFFGSHRRVADAVAASIRANPDLGVVGLLGPWGSGKSTVVEMVAASLLPSHRIFTYDAWLHQSDPPRRSFLERFIAFLEADGALPVGGMEEGMDRLIGRIVDTTRIETPQLTPGGKALLLSVVASAVASRFLGTDWAKQTMESGWRDLERYPFPLALVTCLSPLLLAACLTWIGRRRGSSERLLDLLVTRQVQRQTTRTVKDPEPSTLEFQRFFRDLLREEAVAERPLLIVVDNLDRLPEAEAMEMWNTIRSFFLGAIPPTEKPMVAAMPTVLLPVDPAGLARLHTSDGGSEVALLKSFMDKTFDVVFHVAAPVVSDWQNYMTLAMRKAFPSAIVDRWGFEVARIYSSGDRGRVTPRELNRQINAMAALWLQCSSLDVPFPVVAYYSMHRDELDRDLLQAIERATADLSDHAGWKEALAAIHFGIPPRDAVQVLLAPEISATIADLDHERFGRHISYRGFDRVVIRLIDEDSLRLPLLTNLAELLAGSVTATDWGPRLWERVARVWMRSELQDRLRTGKNAGRLFELLMANVHDDQRVALLDELRASIEAWRKPTVGSAAEKPEAALSSLLGAWFPHARGPEDRIEIHDATTYLSVAAPLIESSDSLGLIIPASDPDALARSLAASLTNGDHPGIIRKMRLTLHYAPGESGLAALFAAAVHVAQKQGTEAEELGIAYHLLGLLRCRHRPAAEWLAQQATTGGLTAATESVLEHWAKSPATTLLALCILEGADLPVAPTEEWYEDRSTNSSLIGDLDRLIDHYGQRSLEQLVRHSSDHAARPLVVRLLGARIEAEDLGHVDGPMVGQRLAAHLAIVPETLVLGFLRLVSTVEGFWAGLEQTELGESEILAYEQLMVGRPRDPVSEAALASLQRFLAGRSDGWWKDRIEHPKGVVRLLRRILDTGRTLRPAGTPLFDAVQTMMHRLTDPEDAIEAEAWFVMADLLSPDSTKTMLRTLGEMLERVRSVELKLSILRAGGDRFLESAGFQSRADAAVRHLVIPLAGNLEGMLWLATHSGPVNRWVAEARVETRTALRDRLARNGDEKTSPSPELQDQLLNDWRLDDR